jgi:parallel beta-helix repeat protein
VFNKLLGPDGVSLRLIGAHTGDGQSSASAKGGGGGIIEVTVPTAIAHLNPSVQAFVAAELIDAGGDVLILAQSASNVSSYASSRAVGFVKVGKVVSTVHYGGACSAFVGSPASGVSIDAIREESDTVRVRAENVRILAGGTLKVRAETDIETSATSSAKGGGFVAVADADAINNTNQITNVLIGSDVTIAAKAVDLEACVANLHPVADAEAVAGGFTGSSTADAVNHIASYANVLLEGTSSSHATITGWQGADLESHHTTVDPKERAKARFYGLSIPDDNTKQNATVENLVAGDPGVTVMAGPRIFPGPGIPPENVTSLAQPSLADIELGDLAFFVDLSNPVGGRHISWDAALVLLCGQNPELVVDAAGNIKKAVNITVNGGQHSGPVVGDISIDPIPKPKRGQALFRSNSIENNPAVIRNVSGEPPEIRLSATFTAVQIRNKSDKNLILNALDVVCSPASTPVPEVVLDVDETSNFEFDVVHVFEPTRIEAENSGDAGGSPEILLAGVINNPVGETRLINRVANIRSIGTVDPETGPEALVRSNISWFEAPKGEIGDDSGPVYIQPVLSDARPTGMNATAGGDIRLDMKGLVRRLGAGPFAVTIDSLEAGGQVQVNLQESLQQTAQESFDQTVQVVETIPDPDVVTDVTTHFRPGPDDPPPQMPPLGVFGTGGTAIDSTYDFGLLQAGGDIDVVGEYDTVAIHVTAGTNILGDGDIDVETNGDIVLTETEGDLRAGQITSTANDVTLTAPASILDAQADAASDVNGNNIVLTAVSGSIGTRFNDLEIDSSYSAAGRLTASAAQHVYVTEVQGSLDVEQAISSTVGDIRLTVAESSAAGEDLLVIVGKTVRAANGSVTLQAGDDVFVGGDVFASEAVFIRGDFRNADPGVGTTITLCGSMVASFAEITGDSDDDLIDATVLTVPVIVFGFAGDDTLFGGLADDRIYGGAGADTIYGGPGNDLLVAGSGVGDALYGGPGNDRIYGSDDGAETDDDFHDGTRFGDLIEGGDGDDTIWGLGGADFILGGSGNDVIDGGAGSDLIYGGAGDDILYAGVGLHDQLHGDDGNDIIYGSHVGDDLITGGAGNDRLFGQGGDDVIDGGAGHDLLDGGPGTDVLWGGSGDDQLRGGGGAGDTLYGEEGDDLLYGSDDGPDQMFGGPGRDRLLGFGGNDWLEGGPGDDILDGGSGDDTLSGDSGSDLLLGGAGHDLLYALNAAGSGADGSVDYLYGDFGTNGNEPGSGRDRLFGDAGIDLLYGEGDDDFIDPGSTGDIVDYGGGEGADPADYVPPVPTANPPVEPVGAGISRAEASLPSGPDDRGRWAELGGRSASGLGVSGDDGMSVHPSIAVTAAATFVAWADTRHGNLEIYAAQHTASGWAELAGSSSQGGVSDSLAPSRNPSITVDTLDRPIVAWTEATTAGSDIYVALYDPTAADGAGDWLELGSSLSRGGISNTGSADTPFVLHTSFGPVVAWLDRSAGTPQVYARVFTGGSWQELGPQSGSGGGISQAIAGSDVRDLALAAAEGRVAAAWSQRDATSGIRQIYLLEYDANGWHERSGSASGAGTSAVAADEFEGVISHNAQPSLAYLGNDLFVAWQTFSDQGGALIAVRYPYWPPQLKVCGTFDDPGLPSQPRLASGGGELYLVSLQTPRHGQPTRIDARRWNGSQFVEEIAGDATHLGISQTGEVVQRISAAVDAAGRPAVAWEDTQPGRPEIFVRSNRQQLSGSLFVASPAGDSVQQILDAQDLGPGDAIVVSGTVSGEILITAGDAGVAILGTPGSQLIGNIQIQAPDVVLQRLHIVGDVAAHASDRLTLRENVLFGSLLVSGGADGQISHNEIVASSPGILLAGDAAGWIVRDNVIAGGDYGIAFGDPEAVWPGGAVNVQLHDNRVSDSTLGVLIAAASSGLIFANDVAATDTALDARAEFAGPIHDNAFHSAAVGVRYDLPTDLFCNRIFGNTTGVIVSVDSTTGGLGFFGSGEPNQIFANQTGVQLTGRMQNQHVHGNALGVSGSGLLGGETLDTANLIEANQVGVRFQGIVQYNRIAANEVGLDATQDQLVVHNLVYRNTLAGVRVSDRDDVRIVGNTFYAPTGNNIELLDGASRVEILNNILWAEGGYDLFVSNDSQQGFFSDYNNLYASESGKLVHWIRASNDQVLDFEDILDWQQDVHRYDLHSIGRTRVQPDWSEPRFLNRHADDYRVFEPLAGQRFASPTVGAADPLTVWDLQPRYVNQLLNPGFENGLSGWDTNTTAATKSVNPAPFEGSVYFAAGADAVGFAVQTVDLLAAGFAPTELDARQWEVVFGGRIRSGAEQVVDEGELRLTFRDASDGLLQQVVRPAANTVDRWERVGDRVQVPVGTRKISYRFTSTRRSGSDADPTNDSYLDAAFLYLVGEDVALDQGAYGEQGLDQPVTAPRIALRNPDLYVDWLRDVPGTILWDTIGNVANLPVRIDLYQDGIHGPEFVLNIADVTDDDGEYVWTPADFAPHASVDYGAAGLRIQVSLVGDPLTCDRSSEPFTIPENTNQFYVNVRGDADFGDNEYTAAAGDNRHTGKLPDRPKPYPNNVLRIYSLGANQTLYTDTGSYALFEPTVISGIVGVGDDEGFVWTGPTEAAHSVDLWHAHPATVASLVELNDADHVTIEHFVLDHALRGLWLHGGSTWFTGRNLSLSNHAEDGILITGNAEFTQLHDLVVNDNGRYGIHAQSAIEAVTGSAVQGNAAGGIRLVNQEGLLVADNLVHDNGPYGIYFQGIHGDTSDICGNTVRGNARGIYVNTTSSTPVTISTNRVFENSVHGIEAHYHALITGNAVHDNSNRGILVDRGGQAAENVVFHNAVGIQLGDAYSSATGRRNRVYHNAGTGIMAYRASVVDGNVVYSNPLGINALPGTSRFTGSLTNNLVYGNSSQAIRLERAQDAGIFNNTIYQETGAGVRIQNSSQGVKLRNNIIRMTAGHGITVTSDSQEGFQSDYNVLLATGSGQVGSWQSVSRPTLVAWQNAAFTDQNSLDQDPLFVAPYGDDGQLGYVDLDHDGRDDDFHLQSFDGRFTGSLTPVFFSSTGLPGFLPVVERHDGTEEAPIRSPAIDRGDAESSFVQEPAPHGSFVNLGAYGNTEQASKSPAQYVLVTLPDGGEVWPSEQTFPVRWRSDVLENDATGGMASDYAAEVMTAAPLAYWRLNEGGEVAADVSASLHNHDGRYENGVYQGARSLLLGDLAARFDGSDDRIQVPDDPELQPAEISVEAWIHPASGIGSGDAVLMKSSTNSRNDGYGLYYASGNIVFYVNHYSSGSAQAAVALDRWSHVVGTYDGSHVRLYLDGEQQAVRTLNATLNHSTAPLQIGQGCSNSAYSWTGLLDEVAIYDRALSSTEVALHHTVGRTPLGTTVAIELIRDGDAGFSELIADDVMNSGEYPWQIPATVVPQDDYRLRVTRLDTAGLTDTSNHVFSISAPITTYYVNLVDDIDFSDNEYTTAAGDDAHSGLTPDQPKASIRSVLEAFDLNAGDTILVDTGHYLLPANIRVLAEDAGVTIRGAQEPGHVTILDRGNQASGSYVFELINADDLTLDHLTITGGYHGVYAGSSSDSDRVTIRNSRVHSNARAEILLEAGNDQVTIAGCEIFDPTNHEYEGIRLAGDRATISSNQIYGHKYGIWLQGRGNEVRGNTVYDNTERGISWNISYDFGSTFAENIVFGNRYGIWGAASSASTWATVVDNHVFDNSYRGIDVTGNVQVVGNTASGHTNAGIWVKQNAEAISNTAYGNARGIIAGDTYGSAVARNNRVFDNSEFGILAYRSSLVEGNVSYSNRTGLGGFASGATFQGALVNNVSYDNRSEAVLIDGAAAGARVVNNTLYQPQGNGLVVRNQSSGVDVRNNILWVEAGTAITVNGDSQNGFTSDYNLIYTPGSGQLGDWGGVLFESRADWFYELGLGRNSLAGETASFDPRFVDVDGDDNVLGFRTVPIGSPQIIDDGDPGFVLTGSGWTSASDEGAFNGDETAASSGSGSNVATWTFTELMPGGTYQVAATWRAIPANTSAAHFQLFEETQPIGWQVVNQRYAPAGLSYSGHPWQLLGTVSLAGDTLTVRLADDTSGRVVADAVYVQQIEGDGGCDDNFHVQLGSPAVDGGDMVSVFSNEPLPNGERINLGAYGNTSEATASAAELVQVLSPNGLEKFEVGQPMQITWHASGLPSQPADDSYALTIHADAPLAYYRLGESADPTAADSSGNSLHGTYLNGPSLGSEGVFGAGLDTAVSFDGINDLVEVPDHDLLRPDQITVEAWVYPATGLGSNDTVLAKTTSSSWNDGYGMYNISGGQITFFVNRIGDRVSADLALDEWSHVVGTYDGHMLRLYVNGEQLATKALGTTITHSLAPLRIGQGAYSGYTWTGRIDEVALYDRALSADQIQRHYRCPPAIAVDLELVEEASAASRPIAVDVLAAGALSWTIPADVPADREYRIRLTARDGQQPSDLSNEPFQIANDGYQYFVNIAGDTDLTDNEYTTAAGDNRNLGKSAASPLSSLRAVLAAYDLDAGDMVFVDTGPYRLVANVLVSSRDAGVTIQGAQEPGHMTILDRDNLASGSYVFELINADDLTLDHLTITGGYHGVYAGSGSDSDRVTVRNSRLHSNARAEILLEAGNDQVTIAGCEIFDPTHTEYEGIRLEGDRATISSNQISGHKYGIWLQGRGNEVRGNTVYDNTERGISWNISYDFGSTFAENIVFGNRYGIWGAASSASTWATVVDNHVFDNSYRGIDVTGNVQVVGNTASGHTNAGIWVKQNAEAISNTAYGNARGVVAGDTYGSAVARNNHVFDNSEFGILAYRSSLVEGNVSYSNRTGLGGFFAGSYFTGTLVNNVSYDNQSEAVLIDRAAAGARVVNNTLYQPQGNGLVVRNQSSGVDVRNNILWVAAGTAITVNGDSQNGFTSDYNLIYTPGSGQLGDWGGVLFESHADWYFELGLDQNSLVGETSSFDPQLDEDFHARPGSPTIDAGDWASPYLNEPAPNGARINLGADGNTSRATTSPAEFVQLLSPNGLKKFEIGQHLQITWHASGLPSQPADDSYALTVQADVPLAYYRLGESAGPTAADSSGNSLHGTYLNGPGLGSEGVFGAGLDTAASFDGINDLVEVPDHDLLRPDQITVEAWVYPATGLGSNDTVLAKTTSSSWNDGYGMYNMSGGQITFFVNRIGDRVSADLALDEWSHVVGTYDGHMLRLYVNGEQLATKALGTTITHSLAPLRIGQGAYSGYTWTGRIDEVAIYNRALSAQQIQRHYRRPPAVYVDLELVEEASGASRPIADDVLAAGVFSWTISADVAADRDYRIRLTARDGQQASDLSNEPFQIANDGHQYFVNLAGDTDLTDNEYTTAAGDNTHTGKDPASPMASLPALLRAYDLDAGDIVYVDTGHYVLHRNLLLDSQDAGLHLLGSRESGHFTLLDRQNTVDGSYVVELDNADGVTIDSLSLTGGYYGVYASEDSHSDGVTLQEGRVFDNLRTEIFLRTSNDDVTIRNTEVFDIANSGYDGIYLEGNQVTLSGNVVHDHRDGMVLRGRRNQVFGNTVYANDDVGISLSNSYDSGSTIVDNTVFGNTDGISTSSTNASTWVTVRGNEVHDNRQCGIAARGNVHVTSNVVRQNAVRGIWVYENAVASSNVVQGNPYGIVAGTSYNSAAVRNNRVYNSSSVGILAYRASVVEGNVAYDNSIGIQGARSGADFHGSVLNNLVYANTNQGILITNGMAGCNVVNNTVYQEVGDAVRIQTSSANVVLRNNVLWVQAGHDLFVAADSQSGFTSDYNLFHQGDDPSAFVGYWGGTDADRLSDWQSLSGQDAQSLEGDPLFVDIDGADNVLGFDPAGDGFDGGQDDNFILLANSPAIDQGHSWQAPPSDLQGSQRIDDPGTVNQGSPEYFPYVVHNAVFPVTIPGTPQGWRRDDAIWTYTLPFAWTFYGTAYATVYVSSNGLLQFASMTNASDPSNTTAELVEAVRIAPLWDDLRTSGTGDDIFIDDSQSDRVTIRWDATNKSDDSDVQFAVTLVDTGAIQFHYGTGNTNLTPTVGISSGNGRAYQLLEYDGQSDLSEVPSIELRLEPGIVDLGRLRVPRLELG